MKVIEKQNATGSLGEYSSNIANEPVIITSNGKPIAVLVSIENTDIETVSLSNNQKFLELIERSRSRHRAKGGVSSEEMRHRLGLGESKKA